MICIGLDLAWSPRNPTGAAVVVGDEHGGQLRETALLGTNDEILQYVDRHAGQEPCLIGVDAPLVVPNTEGRRESETALAKVFSRYQAGAHPANRQRLTFDGEIRGEALVAALAKRGFVHDPMIVAGAATRQVIEVFPHPAMVALFGLERTLKYKIKPKRSREFINAEWLRYQHYLAELKQADPPLYGQETIVAQPIGGLKGRALKNYEDQIDALMCAYIVLYGFRWGETRCQVFGTLETGSIFTPLLPEQWRDAAAESP